MPNPEPRQEIDEAIALLKELGPRLLALAQRLSVLDHDAGPPVQWAAVHVAPIVYYLQAARTNFTDG